MTLTKLQLKKRPIVGIEARVNIRTIQALYDEADLEGWQKFFTPIIESKEVYRHDRELLTTLINSVSANKKRGEIDKVLVKLAARVGQLDDYSEEITLNDTERFMLRQVIGNANYGDIPLVEWAAFDEELMEILEKSDNDEQP